MKPSKSTSCIVRLKDGSEEKQTDDGRLFHTLTTRSAKKTTSNTASTTRFEKLICMTPHPWCLCFCGGRSKLKVIYIYRQATAELPIAILNNNNNNIHIPYRHVW